SAAAPLHGVECASHPRKRIEEEDNILADLDLPFGIFKDELCEAYVALTVAVARACKHLAADGSEHVGDFLRAFVDEEDDEINFRMVCADGERQLLHEHCLAGFG